VVCSALEGLGLRVLMAHTRNKMVCDPTVKVEMGGKVVFTVADIRKLPKIGSLPETVCARVVVAVQAELEAQAKSRVAAAPFAAEPVAVNSAPLVAQEPLQQQQHQPPVSWVEPVQPTLAAKTIAKTHSPAKASPAPLIDMTNLDADF